MPGGRKEYDDGVKRMDVKDFKDLGYLQEVNRLFFHPLGLALEVFIDEDGEPINLGGIWDYRDDEEGMFFGPGMIKKSKIDHIELLRQSKIDTRKGIMSKYGGIEVDENGVQVA